MTAPLPALRSLEEVAAALGVKERYIQDKCRARLWPHRRLERGRIAFTDTDYATVLELIIATPQAEQPTGLSFAPRARRAS